jgi:aminoglycoside phosphotransferase (APT) family kinase protein
MHLEPQLHAWVENVAFPGRTVVDAHSLVGGYSNDNRLVTTADGGKFVLRRYLGGNSCAVEAALAARLAGIVPVPEVIGADPDGSGAGEPVLLSAFAPGRPLDDVLLGATGPEAAELGRETGRTLAAIGSVEFAAPGFFSDTSLEPGPPDMEPTSGVDAFVQRCLEEGNAAGHLGDDEQRALLRFAAEAAPDLAVLHGSRRLVHADFNPKNLLAVRTDGRWRLSAVLDWEYAYSSSPLFDVGNMLRDPRPAGFGEAFVDGFREGGGDLPGNWRRLSQALDLYSLADLLRRPTDHRYFRRAVDRIRALIAA